MLRLITFLFVLFYTTLVFAQERKLDKIADSITNEGKRLYRSEYASWYGTDVFLEKFPAKRQLSGGYLSYETDNGLHNIFFTKGDNPDVLVTTTFNKDLDPKHFTIDSTTRKLNAIEKQLFTMRHTVVSQIVSRDTLYKLYNNTELNPVPLISNENHRVYVLTGTNSSGVVIFGNDYQIDFDQNNNIINRQTLHKTIIPAYISKPGDTAKIQVAGMHSHLPQKSEFITATDICTLMLYERFTTWGSYYVISKNYVSIWDCKKNDLLIMTMEAWKHIEKDQIKRDLEKQQ